MMAEKLPGNCSSKLLASLDCGDKSHQCSLIEQYDITNLSCRHCSSFANAQTIIFVYKYAAINEIYAYRRLFAGLIKILMNGAV